MAEPWTERYRPRRLDQVVGNPQAVADLKAWAEAWKAATPKQRAVLLVGPPGCGKTSLAHALAAQYEWTVVELNASDARSAPAIERVAGQGSLHRGFAATGEFQSAERGQRTLIILDEADNLYERAGGESEAGDESYSDRGGKRAILQTVERTQQPIVLIANDAYALTRGIGERLARHTRRIALRRLPLPTVKKVLRDVSAREGVAVADGVLDALAARARGDLRSALNDLEAVAAGRDRVEGLGELELGERNQAQTAFDTVAAILRSTGFAPAVFAARALDEPPDFLLAWLDENVPHEYRDPRDLERAYEALSRADVWLGRARRRQQFALWGYATEVLAGGVATAKTAAYRTPPRYQFPGWILHMGRTKGERGLRDRLAGKVGAYLHMGTDAAQTKGVPFLRAACRRDRTLAVEVASRCGLDAEEVACLLGEDASQEEAEAIATEAETRRHSAARGAAPPARPPEATGPSRAGRHRRATLGDF